MKRFHSSTTKLFFSVMLGVFAVLVLSQPAGAQQRNGRRIYEEQLRVRMDDHIPQAREMGLEAGGWFSFAFFQFDDTAARKKRTLRQFELRLWASVNLQGVHRGYVRGLTGWDDWNRGDNPNGRGDEDTDPQIERAWYQFNFTRWVQIKTGRRPPIGFKVKVGREYASLGTGLVLSLPLDLVQMNFTAGDWELMGLLAKTISRTNNIDDSASVSSHMQRNFWALQLRYNGFARHRPFAYYFVNTDHTQERPRDANQNYEYDSRYIGLGSEGTILLPDLRYHFEIVGEYGRSYAENQTATTERIRAMAMDFMLEYLFRTKMKPRISFEYIFGSGDSDRRLSATSTVGGNQAGTKDRAFNAFGFRDTGIAFSPKIANLNTYILGFSFYPFENTKLLRRMEIGTKVFMYHKHHTNGPISDTTATQNSAWVGWEWDVYCDWRITSDLTWTIRYGAFRPGAAFPNQSVRDFLYTAVTFSF